MSNSKHTPGPWVTNGRAVEQGAPRRRSFVVAYVEDEENPDADANARLIAAAPELLAEARAQLKFLLEVIPSRLDHPRVAALQALIAKAEGAEQPAGEPVTCPNCGYHHTKGHAPACERAGN